MPKSNSDWNVISEKNKNELVNSLGNLTLLIDSKNASAGKKSFQDKIKIYNGKNGDVITSFVITQEIEKNGF